VLQQLQEGRHKVALLLHGHMHHMIKGGLHAQLQDDPAGQLVRNRVARPDTTHSSQV
jgi:hypothetical protein